MPTNKPEVVLPELARRAIPFLRDEGANYEDDGSNEPLELAREIESVLSENPNRDAANPGGCECEKCGRVFIGAEWHSLCGVCVDTLTRPAAGEFVMVPRSELERVIHELRTYNPIADEYKGVHIHSVWARELESLSAAPQHVVQEVVGTPYRCDYCGADYGARACCDMRYEYLRKFGENILPPLSAQQPVGDGWEVVVTGWTKGDGKTLWLENDGEPMFRIGARGDMGTNKAIHLIGRIPSSTNDAQQQAGAVAERVSPEHWIAIGRAQALAEFTEQRATARREQLTAPTIDIGKLRELVTELRESESRAAANSVNATEDRDAYGHDFERGAYKDCADRLTALIGDGGEAEHGRS